MLVKKVKEMFPSDEIIKDAPPRGKKIVRNRIYNRAQKLTIIDPARDSNSKKRKLSFINVPTSTNSQERIKINVPQYRLGNGTHHDINTIDKQNRDTQNGPSNLFTPSNSSKNMTDWINSIPSSRKVSRLPSLFPMETASSSSSLQSSNSTQSQDKELKVGLKENEYKRSRKVKRKDSSNHVSEMHLPTLPNNRGSYILHVSKSKILSSIKSTQRLPRLLRTQLSSTNIIQPNKNQSSQSKIDTKTHDNSSMTLLTSTDKQHGRIKKILLSKKKKAKEADMGTTTRSFLPRQAVEIIQSLVRKSLNDQNIVRPIEQQFEGCVCFIDISGFSSMCHRLTNLENSSRRRNEQSSPHNSEVSEYSLSEERIYTVEDIARNINAYFGSIIKVIHQCGGEVVKIGGDSLEVLFEDKDLPLSELCLRGVLCALQIQKRYPIYKYDGIELTLHIGISCGKFISAIVGGVNDEFEFVVLGQQSFRNLAPAVDGAKAEQVAITRECYELLSQNQSISDYLFFSPLEGTTRAKLVTWNRTKGSLSKMMKSFKIAKPEIPLTSKVCTEMKKLLSESVQRNIDNFQTEYMADVRRVCSVFIDLSACVPKIDNDTFFDTSLRESTLTLPLQTTVAAIQTVLKSYQGVISQIIQDEKGLFLLAGFGIPPYFSKYDAARAVVASKEIQMIMKGIGIRHKIGIATGMTFYGTLGDCSRQIVTLISHRVNLAARLMAQRTHFSVLCDDVTKKLSDSVIQFSQMDSLLNVKGIKGEIQVYTPVGTSHHFIDGDGNVKLQTHEKQKIQYIVQVRDALIAKLEKHVNRKIEQFTRSQTDQMQSSPTILLFSGTSGCGKAEIVWKCSDIANRYDFRILYCHASQVFMGSPFYIWKQIFQQLSPKRDWSLEEDLDLQQKIQVTLDFLDEYVQRIPRIMIVLRSLHLVDEWSLKLIYECTQRYQKKIIFLASMNTDVHRTYSTFKEIISISNEFQIPKLSISETEHFIEIICNCSSVDNRIVQLVHEKSMGSISYMQEILRNLQKRRVILVVNNTLCTVDTKGLEGFALPQKIMESLTAKFDQLHIDIQFVYKIASVLAYECSFRVPMLIDVFPLVGQRYHHEMCLEKLKQYGVLELQNKKGTFRYKSQQAQSYRRMLKLKKCELHLQAVQWLKDNEQQITPLYDTLENEIAFHIIQAVTNGEKSELLCVEVMNYKYSSARTLEAYGRYTLAIQHLRESITFAHSENCILSEKDFYLVRAEQSIERLEEVCEASKFLIDDFKFNAV